MMRTYNRNGVQIEQCDSCRGIFLDYGELESLTQLEGRWSQQAPPPPPPPPPGMPPMAPPQQYGGHAPGWGAPYQGHGHHRHKSFGKMLFSS
jgi:Zn-finger nucleic acid-binding protein